MPTYVVLDLQSGTYFPADSACLLDTDSLTPSELDALMDGSDTERMLLVDVHGIPLTPVA